MTLDKKPMSARRFLLPVAECELFGFHKMVFVSLFLCIMGFFKCSSCVNSDSMSLYSVYQDIMNHVLIIPKNQSRLQVLKTYYHI